MRFPFLHSPAEARPDAPPPALVPRDATVVLMVDDEPAQRQLFAFALRREGYHVLEARNGAEALDLAAQAGRVDLVVSDVVMPVMKGPEMVQRLRERFPDVQVLFVSGFLMTEDLAQNASMMQKPFVRKDLLKSVYDLVGPARQPKSA
jgi:two-component system cell cycle sensor histidine kinase/response regulator CckA